MIAEISNWGKSGTSSRVTVCHLFSVKGKYTFSSFIIRKQVFYICLVLPASMFLVFKSANTFILSCDLKYRISWVRYFLLLYEQWQFYLNSDNFIEKHSDYFNQFSGNYCLSYFSVWNYWWLNSSPISILQYMPGLLSQP